MLLFESPRPFWGVLGPGLSKNRFPSESVIHLGTFWKDFGAVLGPCWNPKVRTRGPNRVLRVVDRGSKWLPPIGKNQFCGRPGPKMLPNGSEDSKSDHFGHRFYDLSYFTAFLSTNSPFVSYFTRVCECENRWFLADPGQYTRVFRC